MFIIVAGNVVDGLTFAGPFTSAEQANEYGDSAGIAFDVAELIRPGADADFVYRAVNASTQLVDAWQADYAADEEINGADMVDFVGGLLNELVPG